MIRRNAPLLLFALACALSGCGLSATGKAYMTCATADRALAASRSTLAAYTEAYQDALGAELAADPARAEDVAARATAFRSTRGKLRLAITSAHAAVGVCESTAALVESRAADPAVLQDAIKRLLALVAAVTRDVAALTGGR